MAEVALAGHRGGERRACDRTDTIGLGVGGRVRVRVRVRVRITVAQRTSLPALALSAVLSAVLIYD